jgi:hypothetical protein
MSNGFAIAPNFSCTRRALISCFSPGEPLVAGEVHWTFTTAGREARSVSSMATMLSMVCSACCSMLSSTSPRSTGSIGPVPLTKTQSPLPSSRLSVLLLSRHPSDSCRDTDSFPGNHHISNSRLVANRKLSTNRFWLVNLAGLDSECKHPANDSNLVLRRSPATYLTLSCASTQHAELNHAKDAS